MGWRCEGGYGRAEGGGGEEQLGRIERMRYVMRRGLKQHEHPPYAIGHNSPRIEPARSFR